MSTYRELIYMVSDSVKTLSDDSIFTEEHIAFLLNRYRTYLLKQKYVKKAQEIPLSNYQTVCSKLKEVPTVPGCPCIINDNSTYLRTENKLSHPLTFSDIQATAVICGRTAYSFHIMLDNHDEDYEKKLEYINNRWNQHLEHVRDIRTRDWYETTCQEEINYEYGKLIAEEINTEIVTRQIDECGDMSVMAANNYGNITMVSRERLPYTGTNRFTKKTIYGAVEPDRYIYIKSDNEKFTEFNRLFITAIFEDPMEAYDNSVCDKTCKDADEPCDEWDRVFPIEDALQTQLLALVVKDVLGAQYRPSDKQNNATDDMASIQQFIRQNMKDRYLKGVENEE